MRVLVVIVGLLIGAATHATERLPAFGHEIVYDIPSNDWMESDRVVGASKGMVMYKHTVLKDEAGIVVEPVLSVIYELTPPTITDLDEYVTYAREKTPFNTVRATKLENGTVVFFCTYKKEDVAHSLVIGHLFSSGVGVQVISDTTVSLLEKISADQKAFVSSAVLKVVVPPIPK